MENPEIACNTPQTPTAEELKELVVNELVALGFRLEDEGITPINNDKDFQQWLLLLTYYRPITATDDVLNIQSSDPFCIIFHTDVIPEHSSWYIPQAICFKI